THKQQEAQVPPAVAEAAQVGRAVAAVRIKDYRDLADLLSVQARLDNHFTGEFHSGTGQPQPFITILTESAQAAVGVADRRVEEQVQDAGEPRIADVAVQPGHGPRPDAPPEAVAHHQVVALPQLLHKRLNGAEIVGIVGVAHDHVLAAGGRYSSLE